MGGAGGGLVGSGLGLRASAIFCRGYYTRAYLWAVDFDGSKLSTRWRHASLSNKTVMKSAPAEGSVAGGFSAGVSKDVRTYTRATYAGTTHCTAYSQGNHNLSVADVDGDGMDEIIYGSAAIDHDGNLLWSTGLNHGDAIHVGDLMPDRPGLEVFQIHEDPPFGMHICDAATGELLIHMTGDGDTARGIAGDFTPQRGYEFCYFGDGSLYNAPTGSIVGPASAQNFRVYWDGDIFDEILNDKGGGHNQPFLEKYNNGGIGIDGKRLFEHGYSVSCNGTKTSPCLQADIFGDWREELIFYNGSDKQTLNIFSTSLPSNTRVPCLLYDHVYRMGIAWQNVGYNQPPHLGYYLPDAVAPRFQQYADRAIHYVNCTGAELVSVTAPDGTVSDELPDGITMKQDRQLCYVAFNGQAATKGEWRVTIASKGSSNGTETTQTFVLSLGDTDDIEDVKNESVNGKSANSKYIYDLSGRRIDNNELRKGVYIIGGRKIMMK